MIAAIRLRGKVKTPEKTENTLHMLGLNKIHNCIVIPDEPSYRGMLQKAKDYITWGEIDEETFNKLIEKRSNTDKDPEEIKKGKKEIFKLHPPKGCFKGSKKQPIGKGGELGYRGKKINQLLDRMT